MAVIERTCIGPDCDRRGGDFGYCGAHYQQWKRGKELTPIQKDPRRGRPPVDRLCSFPGCGRRHKARGLCKVHGDHLKKYGELREIKLYNQNLVCGIKGCDRPFYAKGRCDQHVKFGYNLARFSINLEDFVRMMKQQGEVCAICGGVNANGRALSVDHDHTCCPGDRSCGACVRGLLCSACNLATGIMQDDPARLRAAADYLERLRVRVVA